MATIPDMIKLLYADGIKEEFQQDKSRLESFVGHVHTVPEAGLRFQIGDSIDSSQDFVRGYTDTNPTEQNYRMRTLKTGRKVINKWIADDDAHRLGNIGDPLPQIMASMIAQSKRDKDAEIIAGLGGDAQEGDRGQTSVAFDDAKYRILKDFGGADSGITYEKFLNATTRLGAYNVSGFMTGSYGGCTLVCTHFEIEDMLKQEKFTNNDFANAKRSEFGYIENYQGVTIIPVSPHLLPVDAATGVRTCYIFDKNAIEFGVREQLITRIDPIPQKNHSILCNIAYGFGCTRVHDKGVLKLESHRANAADEIAAETVV